MSIMSILVCTKCCEVCLTQVKHFLILLCKPVHELLMLAIWLMYVGVLRKLEMNILNLFEEVLLSFLNGEKDKSRICSPIQIGNFSLVPLSNTLKINGMLALHEIRQQLGFTFPSIISIISRNYRIYVYKNNVLGTQTKF